MQQISNPDSLKLIDGDMLTIERWNSLVDAATNRGGRTAMPHGHTAAGGTDVNTDIQLHNDLPIAVENTGDPIPPYSAFGVVPSGDGGYGSANLPWPLVVQVEQIPDPPTSDAGCLTAIFCNEQDPITTDGTARLIGLTSPARVGVSDNSDIPVVGQQCGVKPGTWGVAASYTGLVCLALDDVVSGDGTFTHFATVVRSFTPFTPIGVVTLEIPAQGGGAGICELYDSNFNDLHESVHVYNLVEYPYGVGVVSPLLFDAVLGHWYPVNIQSVYLGYTSATNVNSGSTATFQFVDDQGSNLFTAVCRAVGYIARQQKVVIWFDYRTAEWAATAINVPLYCKAQATIAYQVTGNVSVLQSDKTDPAGGAVTATPYAAFRTLVQGEFGLMWYDFYKGQLYVVPLNAVLLGRYLGTGYIAAGSTGSIEIFDDQGNDLGFAVTARCLTKSAKNDVMLLAWDATNNEFFAVDIAGAKDIAKDIDFHLSGTLAHGDATASVTVDSYNNGTTPTGTTTVNNTMGWSLPNSGHGWATLLSYDPATGNAVYEIRAVRMTDWSGYSSSVIQALGHDASGNTAWYTPGSC